MQQEELVPDIAANTLNTPIDAADDTRHVHTMKKTHLIMMTLALYL